MTAEIDRQSYDPEDILPRLSHIEILRALPPEEIQALIPFVEHMTYPSGASIIEQGAVGDAMYFIESGTAAVRRNGSSETWMVKEGSVVGEMALLTGETRSASVKAETDLSVWRVSKAAFDKIVAESPHLKDALDDLVKQRLKGIAIALPNQHVWVSTALRALEARYRGLYTWQGFMGIGLVIWLFLFINNISQVVSFDDYEWLNAAFQLLSGLLILQGSCEGFVIGVERMGAKFKWDGFISGTIGSLLSTLPEFVVIGFLVWVEPLAAFITAIATIFNNALAFSVYSFFLPKDRQGCFTMPRSLTKAGGELMIAGCAIALIVGTVMLVAKSENVRTEMQGFDLIIIGLVLMVIYAYYVLVLIRYYAEGKDDVDSMPPDPERLGHDTSWKGIIFMFILGIVGAYCGGEVIGGFAETALKDLGLPTVLTSGALAFFAGISEYIIVYKSHRRGELGIALSNVFGGLTQVMFLLLPFGLLVIGIMGILTGNPVFVIPINLATSLLMLLLFPLFYTLHQYVQQEKNLNNLDAAAMTGIYILLLYFLFTFPN
ncbi:cyclic nucleotide-binding domain-containing protein [bacterium]|nr:cyclic nucleotide-binding domain-containing protein [bacterium]